MWLVRICLFLALVLSMSAYAIEWQDHWEKAVEYCTNKNFESAEAEFSFSIATLESTNNDFHPHVYVDRARLYLLQERYDEALVDLNKALKSPHLDGSDRMRGLVSRMAVYSNKQMEDQFLVDYNAFIAMNANIPKSEFNDERIIIRNVPKSNCFKQVITFYPTECGVCDESDVKFYDSGICIAKRKKKFVDDETIEPAIVTKFVNQENVANCKWRCDKFALAGSFWCYIVFQRFECQAACILTVEGLKDGCHWCCDSGDFYKKCVEPF